MNTLHDAGIEVMSPAVMMQRPIPSEERIMPKKFASSKISTDREKPLPESKIFDKAEKAEALERCEIELKRLTEEREGLVKQLEDAEEGEKRVIESAIADLDGQLKSLEDTLESE